jgi:hypothetical protein
MFTTALGPSSPARLSGRTVDPEGRPLMDCGISVDGDQMTSTGADGSFSMSLPAGNHTLRVERSGFRTRTIELTVVHGEERDLGDIRMEKLPTEDHDQGLWLLVLAGLVMLAILIIAVAISALRKKDMVGPAEE